MSRAFAQRVRHALGAPGSPRRFAMRWAVLSGVAGSVFVLLVAIAYAHDWGGVAHARNVLDATLAEQARLAGLLRALPDTAAREPASLRVSELPRVSPGAATLPESMGASHTAHEDGPGRDIAWRLVVAAHDSGLRVRQLGPVVPGRAHGSGDAGTADGIHYQLAGEGGFGAVARWVRAFAALPMLVVPLRIEVTRRDAGPAFVVHLAVRPIPPGAITASTAARAGVVVRADRPGPDVPDEFGGGAPGSAPRLAGIVGNARHALALFDMAGRASCATLGERIGDERVTRIGARRVWLGSEDGRERHLALVGEAGR